MIKTSEQDMRTDWQTGLHNEKLEQHTDWDGQI